MYRWIAYVWQADIPACGAHCQPVRFQSLAEMKDYAEEYARAVYTDNIAGMIYPYTEDNWELAREYEYVGNPFDYPTKVIEQGKRGALRITNA